MIIQQEGENLSTKMARLLDVVSNNIKVQLPCRVIAVNGNHVDVIPFNNDEIGNQPLYDVKIRHLESSTAYIFLGVHIGDKGVLRFFDRSIDDYSTNGSEGYNEDDRIHDVNDGLFELGFVPDNEAYLYPTDKELEIGLKNSTFKLSVDSSGNLIITGATNIINGGTTINGNLIVNGTITATGEITGNSIALSTHTHTGNLGNPTSAPNP